MQAAPRGRPEPRLSHVPRAGCGNSALSHDLHELGYTDVTSIDFSPACIAAMRARYARCPGLRWAVMDIRALAFPDAAFDVVLEKGTLDVLMVEETDPWDVSPQAAAAMRRVLTEVGGGGELGGRAEGGPHPSLGRVKVWDVPSLLCFRGDAPAGAPVHSATLRRDTWGAPGTLGCGRPPPPFHTVAFSPGRWMVQGVSLGPAVRGWVTPFFICTQNTKGWP